MCIARLSFLFNPLFSFWATSKEKKCDIGNKLEPAFIFYGKNINKSPFGKETEIQHAENKPLF
jgi:hypothetical protein